MGITQLGENHDIPKEHKHHKHGGWLPTDRRIHRAWLDQQITHADANPKPLIPVLQEFKEMIEADTRLQMYFTSMWEEIPSAPQYQHDPTGGSQIRDYKHMLDVLNHTFGSAPEWTDAAQNVGMVGVPMCAILDYAMGTPSGNAAFLDPDVNAMFKKILNQWGEYLKSPESAQVLGDHDVGWFGKTGITDVMAVANAPYKTNYKFEEFFQCEPTKKYYGYTSWDNFFTRQLQPTVRPVASPEDPNVIANACESKVFSVAHNVRYRERFWIKGQPYSLVDMLAHDGLTKQFIGGTIYQAFLSALSYHRWHSPVDGTIKKCYVQDGTYFSEPMYEGVGEPGRDDIDPKGISVGQGYLAALATRAIIFIEADNPKIGLMGFVGIGMDEVSTCDITVKVGDKVKKGDQMGMFHFGGSSHCLMFRKDVKVTGFPEQGRKVNVPVKSQLAVVS